MTTSEKQKKSWLIVVILFAGLLLVLRLFRKDANKIKRAPGTPINSTAGQMAEMQIRSALQTSKYSKYADWIVAIAKFETADFTSRIFKENRNAFGMTVPKIRPFLGTSSDIYHEGQAVAKYSSTYNSTMDFLQYLDYFNYPTNLKTIEEFVSFMKSKGYFSDNLSTYLSGVKNYLDKKEDNISRPAVSITTPSFSGSPTLDIGAIADLNMAYGLPGQNIELPKKKV